MSGTAGAAARGEVGRGRLEALSDGVFAIVVTLLVLEIKVPHLDDHASPAALGAALLGLLPTFASWVISFTTVCVIWLNHHHLLRQTGRLDAGLFWRHANLLLWTSFIPFPTALMGDYPGNRLAVSCYGLVMALMALAFVLVRRRMDRVPGLLAEGVEAGAFRRATTAALLAGPVAYLAAALVAWLLPPLAMAGYAAIALYFGGLRPGGGAAPATPG